MKSRLIKFSFLITGILFCLLVIQNKPVYGEVSIGFYLGYSSTFAKYPYRSGWEPNREFTTTHLRHLLGLQVQYFFRNKKSGISLDIFDQKYIEQGHDIIGGVEQLSQPLKRSVVFLSLSYDFRFFSNKNKKANPYLSLGYVFATISLPDWEDRPYWLSYKSGSRKATGIKLGGGLRYKIKGKILINTAFYYFLRQKFSSGRIGLEYVF